MTKLYNVLDVLISIPGRGKEFSFRYLVHTATPATYPGYRRHFFWAKAVRALKFITHRHLVPRSRIHGILRPHRLFKRVHNPAERLLKSLRPSVRTHETPREHTNRF